MKKIIFLSIILLAIVLSGCEKKQKAETPAQAPAAVEQSAAPGASEQAAPAEAEQAAPAEGEAAPAEGEAAPAEGEAAPAADAEKKD